MSRTMKRRLWKHGRAQVRALRYRCAMRRLLWIQDAIEGRGPWAWN